MTFTMSELKEIEKRTPQQLKALNDWWAGLSEQERVAYLARDKAARDANERLRTAFWLTVMAIVVVLPAFLVLVEVVKKAF